MDKTNTSELSEHDYHLSPNDGCEICEDYYNQKEYRLMKNDSELHLPELPEKEKTECKCCCHNDKFLYKKKWLEEHTEHHMLTCSHCNPQNFQKQLEEYRDRKYGKDEDNLHPVQKNSDAIYPPTDWDYGEANSWENIFFNVYGKPIIEMYEELHRFRNPNKPVGNIGFEGGRDFQGMIQSFIRSHFIEKKVLQEKIEGMKGEYGHQGGITYLVKRHGIEYQNPHGERTMGYVDALDDLLEEIKKI